MGFSMLHFSYHLVILALLKIVVEVRASRWSHALVAGVVVGTCLSGWSSCGHMP